MITAQGELPRGMDLLNRQGLNKGTAFTDAERAVLGLQGLLPPHVETLDQQSVRGAPRVLMAFPEDPAQKVAPESPHPRGTFPGPRSAAGSMRVTSEA